MSALLSLDKELSVEEEIIGHTGTYSPVETVTAGWIVVANVFENFPEAPRQLKVSLLGERMLAFFDVNKLCSCDGSLLLHVHVGDNGLAILSEAVVATLVLSSTDCVEMTFSALLLMDVHLATREGDKVVAKVLLPTMAGFVLVECDVCKLSIKRFRGLSTLADVHVCTGAASFIAVATCVMDLSTTLPVLHAL